MRKLSKKGKIYAAAATVALVAASGGAAYAYWTTTGTGSGAAANSAGGGTVTLRANFNAGSLTPGGSVVVTYTADNGSLTTDTKVGVLTVQSITTDSSGCLPGWFSADANTGNATVLHNSTNTTVGTGTLAFANSTANQDACKGATVTINVTSN